MRVSPWRLAAGMLAAILLAGALGVVLGSLAGSQGVAAFTFGAILLAVWLGFMARTKLRVTSAEGTTFRFHPLYVAGISVLICAISLLLVELMTTGVAVFGVGLILVFMGRRRSGPVGLP